MKVIPLKTVHQYDREKSGLAIMQFAELVNNHLKTNNSKERLFIIGNTENTRIIFLTKDLHKLIASVIKNKNIQPLEPKTWAKWNQLI
jgi:hypothetical protein